MELCFSSNSSFIYFCLLIYHFGMFFSLMNVLRRAFGRTKAFQFLRYRPLGVWSIVPYVLIGGGTASYYASLTIRARDPDARVLIISDEKETPYRRGPLSKELWWFGADNFVDSMSYSSPISGKRRYVCYEADGFYLEPDKLDQWKHGGVALMRGTKVARVDKEGSFVELEDGRKIEFGKCLIATGSNALCQNIIEDNPELRNYITVLGKIEDFREMHSKMEEMASTSNAGTQTKVVVILGGGLLGTELAYSLNRRYARDQNKPSLKIIQLCCEPGILSDILPPSLSAYATELLREQGIEIRTNAPLHSATVQKTEEGKHKLSLNVKGTATSKAIENQTSNRPDKLLCDHFVVALGAEPRIELAENSGFALDKKNGGILADEHLRIHRNVWTAGDVCSFIDPILNRRRRCTHWQHAQITGRMAGENMTDGQKTYTHHGAFVTMFSPFGHICGIGDVDPRTHKTTTVMAVNGEKSTEESDEEEEARAVIFYTDQRTNKIAGVLLFNILGMGEEWARKLIRDAQPLHRQNLKDYAKLFELWDEEENEQKDRENEEASDTKVTEDELEAYQLRED